MNSDIQQLKEMFFDSTKKLSDTLRFALSVAHNHDKSAVSWITNESNGYARSEVPEYRIVHGTPIAKNFYNKWEPLTAEPKLQRLMSKLSKLNLGSGIAELENYINSPEVGFLRMPYPPSIQEDFSTKFTSGQFYEFALHINKQHLSRVLSGAKDKLWQWVIELENQESSKQDIVAYDAIFPQKFISQLPKDVGVLAGDFNFNFSDKRAYPCMLILRRMLPLAIVRRFLKDGKEHDIKGKGEDYLSPEDLLDKTNSLVNNKKNHRDVKSCKMLLDAFQHSYTFHPELSEVNRTATALRVFLEELFPKQEK